MTSNTEQPNDGPPISEGQAAARGTLATLILRLVSFVCTQATFRILDPVTLGKASIRLELLLTTVLFISREGFRLALTRNISPTNWNVAWLTVPVVTIVAGSTLLWHLSVSGMDPDYRLAGVLYCLASWIEGCAEPAVLHFLRRMDVPKRASAEGLAAAAKTAATIASLRFLTSSWHVTAFGISQLVYACTYASYLYGHAYKDIVWPTRSFPTDSMKLTAVFTLQGFFKHLLTEADRIVLTAVADDYDQGVYAMGSAYGGMAARIVLQPLEENARLLWSRQASGQKKAQELKQSYAALVKVVLYIGLLFSCVGVNYTGLLLNILAGRKWGSNPEASAVLGAFCFYTAFLACNGMTEAFVYGVTSSGIEIGRLGMAHTVTGIAFAAVAPSLVSSRGTLGLVAANCVAMTLRSLYSLHFAARYFGELEKVSTGASFKNLVTEISPHPLVLGGFGLTWAASKWSLSKLQEQNLDLVLDVRNQEWLLLIGQHLALGVSGVVGVFTLAAYVERDFLRKLRLMVRSKKEEKED